MRCVAGAGLLVLVGCNQVFGLSATREFDASIDVAADVPHVVLDYQLAIPYGKTGATPGAPDPTIRFAPIDPAPRVRIATLDGAFDAEPATYSPTDGWIAIPRSYLGITWRLEYTLADGVAREVQWAPDDKVGHLTVPLFGRVARGAAPAVNSGYLLTPTGVAGFTYPRVFTTGLWTEGVVPGYLPGDGARVDYDFSNARSLSGAKGELDGDAGDRALLVDYTTGSAGCRVATGAAPVDPPALTGAHAPSSPAWDTSSRAVAGVAVGTDILGRLTEGLGNLESRFQAGLSFALFGSLASTRMPALNATPEAAAQLGGVLPVPVMVTLMQCPFNTPTPPTPAEPGFLAMFTRALHIQLVDTRVALGATLASGIETVMLTDAGGLKLTFPAPLPMRVVSRNPTTLTPITLATPARGVVELSGLTDQVAVGPRTGAFTLAFSPELGVELRADYFEITLYAIRAGALAPARIYTVTQPTVRIDGAVLSAGVDYVFQIRSIRGHPNAGHGDFATIDFPYGAAIVFTRTFRTE